MAENQICNKQENPEKEGCNGNCKGPAHHFSRHFMTKEDKIERLHEYVKQLKRELQGVEDKIRELEN